MVVPAPPVSSLINNKLRLLNGCPRPSSIIPDYEKATALEWLSLNVFEALFLAMDDEDCRREVVCVIQIWIIQC